MSASGAVRNLGPTSLRKLLKKNKTETSREINFLRQNWRKEPREMAQSVNCLLCKREDKFTLPAPCRSQARWYDL